MKKEKERREARKIRVEREVGGGWDEREEWRGGKRGMWERGERRKDRGKWREGKMKVEIEREKEIK